MLYDIFNALVYAIAGLAIGHHGAEAICRRMGWGSWRGKSQTCTVHGPGNVVIQSGNVTKGDIIGGDLIINKKRGKEEPTRCKYCGSSL